MNKFLLNINLSIHLYFYFQNKSQDNVTHTNSFNQDTELKMGSITEVWKNGIEWQKFFDYLDKQPPEGVDSSGIPLKLSRYAKFLSLYVNLHYKEVQLKSEQQKKTNVDVVLKKLTEDIVNDPEV